MSPDMDLLFECATNTLAMRHMYQCIKEHPQAKFFTYVLLLQQGKMYVGATDNIYARMVDHFTCSPSSALWVREYGPPVRIVEICTNSSLRDEQYKYTEYADKFGYENVRGGGCCKLVMTHEPPSVSNFEKQADTFTYMTRHDINEILFRVKTLLKEYKLLSDVHHG